MVTVYTKRLALVAIGNNVATALYTAPTGHVTIIRDICVMLAATAANVTFQVSIGPIAGGNYPIAADSLTLNVSKHYDIRQELLPGEVLYGTSSSPAGYTVLAVTGYSFLL